ncbi:MAG TPA: FtsX-like permease family protein [Vicinamibacterales bacterium]|jgi:hypothetical protein|nr:FtsX-like permease family protein [Vicinamibacterales bacterium]
MLRRLLAILGRRTILTFGLVTFLVGALLATVNVTSRYALKLYVDDQLQRIPWDLAVYQQGAVGDRTLRGHIAKTEGVTRVENLAFLRARFPEGGEVEAQVDRKPFTTPWLCLLAASDPSILPPQLSFALDAKGEAGTRGAVLSLVGPEYAMGKAFLALQGARDFTLQVHVQDQPRFLFNTPVHKVVRLDRDELNRWLMDQTGSVSYVPYIGTIILMPYEWDILTKFDQVASGLVPADVLGVADSDAGHIQMAEYAPEVVYLARIDRASLVSGWDIQGSLANVKALNARLHRDVQANTPMPLNMKPDIVPGHSHEAGEPAGDDEKFSGDINFIVDSTTEVLLERMQNIARLIGVVSLLVALPLLWMAWVLAANLAGLLMLNERRTLGLMRLRGISGDLMGRALLVSIVSGGFVGGLLGLIAGSVAPLLVYERGHLPPGVLTEPKQLGLFAAFLLISVVLALMVSRRLVTYAMTISPLEASRRVSGSEAIQASMTFGPLQQLSLVVGGYVLFGWTFDFSISATFAWFRVVDRLLDFLGLPLFLYGVATFMASKRERIQHVMSPVLKPIGGVLGKFALRHMSVKPHRTVAFLLIVALMSSVSLYPIITSRSFEDKAIRGAQVQLGTDWQVLFNAPDLVDIDRLSGSASRQLAALKPEIAKLVSSLRGLPGVTDATYMIEAVLPSFYLPGYGLRGVPLYLLDDTERYRTNVYAEPSVGVSADFDTIVSRMRDEVAVSPPVADFWRVEPGSQMLLGLDPDRRAVGAKAAGVLAFLPGLPPKSVSDRQGFVQARVDYLNYLFSSNAYVATSADNPQLASLQILIPRIIVLLRTDGSSETSLPDASFQQAIVKAAPFPPLEIHSLAQEIGKVGSDMYISLALANMRIYLLGGLLLALIAILAVAMANYSEDRRTLALLRIRGASPSSMWRFVVAMLLSPALVGLALGGGSAVLAGFGLANYVWRLREIRTVVQLLPTHLVIASLTGWVVLLLIVMLVGVASAFSWWVFRDTAHESMQGA